MNTNVLLYILVSCQVCNGQVSKVKFIMDTKGLKYTKIIIQNSSCIPVLIQKKKQQTLIIN